MNIEFIESSFQITCGVGTCHKSSNGYSWTLLEAKSPILDGQMLLRPLFLCQEHQEWFKELVKGSTYPQVWKLIEKGGD